MFQIIMKDGNLTGEYSSKKSPALVAKAIMRVLFQKTGIKNKEIRFKDIKTGKEYTYKARIIILENQKNIKIGNKEFKKKYEIIVERI